jgi:hypothetical protein
MWISKCSHTLSVLFSPVGDAGKDGPPGFVYLNLASKNDDFQRSRTTRFLEFFVGLMNVLFSGPADRFFGMVVRGLLSLGAIFLWIDRRN